MPPTANFGFEQLVTEILRGIIETVAERAGETDAQRYARHQTAVFSVMAFLPRDAVETMLAGQCLTFNHLLLDGTRDVLRGQSELQKLRARPQLVAIGNMFLKHLTELTRLRARPVDQIAVVPRAEAAPAAEGPRPASPPRDAAKPAPAPASPVPVSASAARPVPAPAPATPDQAAKEARLAAMLPAFAPAPPVLSLRGTASAVAMTEAARGTMRPLEVPRNTSAKR